MIPLPETFLENMKELLGEEYPEYAESMKERPYSALRINTLKVAPDTFLSKSPFSLSAVPWSDKGFYFDRERDRPSHHPYYFAGLYYIQEPSAMIPAALLPVEPGERVLDLCAAPGGKATELAARLQGEGLLLANDISASRAMALAKNLQMAGVRNAIVTAETPERLAQSFPQYFDRILLDAPCSGEGMFRREPGMVRDWLERGPSWYVPVQREILQEAYKMLKPGGKMVYSTCTFSVQEDEGMIQWFLDRHRDMRICPVKRHSAYSEGRPDMVEGGSEELRHCVRIFPHRAQGEGHFAVLLERLPNESIQEKAYNTDITERNGKKTYQRKGNRREKQYGETKPEWLQELAKKAVCLQGGHFRRQKERWSWLPDELQMMPGLRIVAGGLMLGTEKKERFEPAVPLALALKKEEVSCAIDFPAEDGRIIKYLKGETLLTEETVKGYALLCADGYPLGWVKGNGKGMLKNKYYVGWRMQ